ncbi:hypothetical protein JOM56_001654 [Amanita muscaria]
MINRSSLTHNNNENSRHSDGDGKPGLFERSKWQSSSKKTKKRPSCETTTSDYHSPFNLAQRLQALLDSHPCAQSPMLSPASPLSPVIPGSPLPIQNYDPLPFSPALSTPESHYRGSNFSTSSQTTYFSAQPGADADLVALLSSPELMNSSLPLPAKSRRAYT